MALLIGTHAIIQHGVDIPNLELAIADEQHRFGVEQRAALRHNAHYLMLTATPIPRTMQLTLYRDLDISVIDEMPRHRPPVATHVLDEGQRGRARRAISDQVAQGRQAFVVYPIIDPNPDIVAHAAEARFQMLRDVFFPDLEGGHDPRPHEGQGPGPDPADLQGRRHRRAGGHVGHRGRHRPFPTPP